MNVCSVVMSFFHFNARKTVDKMVTDIKRIENSLISVQKSTFKELFLNKKPIVRLTKDYWRAGSRILD